jgi:hypothetical protein
MNRFFFIENEVVTRFLILISSIVTESRNDKLFEMNYLQSDNPTPPIEAASSDKTK